ncbi:MAG: DUF308 domain-containing protein [Clostridiales bacterium]|nr:DUF308 domain-containing protein [Clostridiales bacterium]
MKKLFYKAKNLSIITIIASIVIGLFLLINPESTIKYVSLFFGVTLIILGVGALVSYFTKMKSVFLSILGTLAIIAGIVVCVKYKSIITVILFMCGLFIIVSGVTDLFTALKAKRHVSGIWIFSVVMSVITIVLGMIVIFNPFDSMLTLTRILGFGLILYAVMDLIAFIEVHKLVKINQREQIDSDGFETDDD